MAIHFENLPMLDFKQANPLLSGILSGQQTASNTLEMAPKAAAAKYALPNAGYESEIKKSQAELAPQTALMQSINPMTLLAMFLNPQLAKQFYSANKGAFGRTIQGAGGGPEGSSTGSSDKTTPTEGQTGGGDKSWWDIIKNGFSDRAHEAQHNLKSTIQDKLTPSAKTAEPTQAKVNTATKVPFADGTQRKIGGTNFIVRDGEWHQAE